MQGPLKTTPITSHSSLSSGYGVLFRHPDDELNYCVYLIPGNPQVTNDKLPYWHERLIKDDGNLCRALGKKAKLERMKVGRFKCILQSKVPLYLIRHHLE